MNLRPVCVCRAFAAGLLVPVLSGCDGGTPAEVSHPSIPARQLGQRLQRPLADVKPASPHAGVYVGSIDLIAEDDGASSDSDSDTEAVLLLGVDRDGRIHGHLRGAPGVAADEWLLLGGTLAHHQTLAPLLLSDRGGRRYGAITLDFKRGGRHREVVATVLRKHAPDITFAALPLEAAAALDGAGAFAPHHLDLSLEDRAPLRDAASFALQLGAADSHGVRRLQARGGDITLEATLRPGGVDGLYHAALQLAPAPVGAPGAAAPLKLEGQAFVERLSDGRLSLTLIAAAAHARVSIEASQVLGAE